jgi:hypothetical protein
MALPFELFLPPCPPNSTLLIRVYVLLLPVARPLTLDS